MPRLKVLLTSAGAKVPLLQALQHAAKRITVSASIVAGDCSTPVVSEYFADEFWIMPPSTEESSQLIVNGLLQRGITHLLPSRDGELLFWATLQPSLAAEGIHVMVSPPQAVQLCLDKYQFSRQLMLAGLPAIPSLLQPDGSSHLWVVKERFGAGSQQIGLALNQQHALAFAQRLSAPLFQPYVPGREISVDAWLNRKGELKAHICRYRVKVQHGESQISQTVHLPQYDGIIRQALQRLKLTGPVVLQAIIDEADKLHIIECNSRFGGASTLGIKAGLDSLYWSLAEACGQAPDALPFTAASQPITQIRYPTDSYL